MKKGASYRITYVANWLLVLVIGNLGVDMHTDWHAYTLTPISQAKKIYPQADMHPV